MRTNPLADRIRDRLQPQWVAFADPFHPDRVLVARRGRDGRPDQERVVATIEKRGELDLFNPIFRHPPGQPRTVAGRLGVPLSNSILIRHPGT